MSRHSQRDDRSVSTLPLGRKLLFALVTVGAVLLLIEGSARLWLLLAPPSLDAVDVTAGSIETDWLDLLEEDLEIPGRRADLYLPDAELFWTLRPGTSVEVENVVYKTRTRPLTWKIRINEEGYRGASHPPDDGERSPLIVALGDSCTFGFRVDETETYPALLQQFLRDQGLPGAAVVNYGVPGYTSFQGKRLLNMILSRHRPDVVILAFGANDLEADRYSDARKAEKISPWRFGLYRALSHLATTRLILERSDPQRTDPDDSSTTTRVSPEEFRANMHEMVRSARSSGASVILLDLVFIGPVFREAIAEIAREDDVPWLDGREILRQALDELLEGKRFREERTEIDRFWQQEVEQYRFVYYDEAFYQKLSQDPVWRGLLQYLMIEPVHPSPLGNRLIAEEAGRLILSDSGVTAL
jgi:lysophospholipase L1-like esterase